MGSYPERRRLKRWARATGFVPRSLQACQKRARLRKIDRFAILPEPAVDRHKDIVCLLPPAASSLKFSARNARTKFGQLRSLRSRSFDRSLEFTVCLIFSVLTGRQ